MVDHQADAHLPVKAVTTAESALWIDLSLQHLWNARHAAALCSSCEADLMADGNHEINLKLRGLAMMAVASAAGFVESFINEIFLAIDQPQNIAAVEGIAPDARNAMKDLWDPAPSTRRRRWWSLRARRGPSPPVRVKRRPVLDKYQAALRAMGKPQAMPKGHQTCQRVQTVIDLRHDLLHYTPEWQTSGEPHDYESRLPPNPNPRVQHASFPDSVLSAALAEWSCNVCVELVDVWSGHMGLTNPPDTGLTKGWPVPGL
jgi:hypothetical protein